MSLFLVAAVGFSLIVVCLVAFCLFDRQRFWGITAPKYKEGSPTPQESAKRGVPRIPLNRYHSLRSRPSR